MQSNLCNQTNPGSSVLLLPSHDQEMSQAVLDCVTDNLRLSFSSQPISWQKMTEDALDFDLFRKQDSSSSTERSTPEGKACILTLS